MRYYLLFKDVLKLLQRNKRQSVLTCIAIGIATFVVLIILSSQSYTFSTLAKDMELENNKTILTFTPNHRLELDGFTTRDQKLISKHTGENVRLVSSSYGKVTKATLNKKENILSFRSINDLNKNNLLLPEIEKSDRPDYKLGENEVAICDKALMKLTRDTKINPYLSKYIKVNNYHFKIVIIYQSSAINEVLPDMILSHSTERKILNQHTFYDQLEVSTRKLNDINILLNLLDQHGSNKDKGTYDFIDQLKVYQDTKKQVHTILNLIALLSSISIFVAGFGVMNALLSSVNERTQEIAIRRAMGAQKTHIYLSYLIEGTLLSIFGGVIGVILALTLIGIFNIIGLVSTVTIAQICITLIIVTTIGIFFSIIPAMVAAHKNVIDGMK